MKILDLENYRGEEIIFYHLNSISYDFELGTSRELQLLQSSFTFTSWIFITSDATLGFGLGDILLLDIGGKSLPKRIIFQFEEHLSYIRFSFSSIAHRIPLQYSLSMDEWVHLTITCQEIIEGEGEERISSSLIILYVNSSEIGRYEVPEKDIPMNPKNAFICFSSHGVNSNVGRGRSQFYLSPLNGGEKVTVGKQIK